MDQQRPVTDLAYQLEQLTTLPLVDENVEPRRERLKQHPFHGAMWSVLVELKQMYQLTMPREEEEERDPQMLRLDNMLNAVGVTDGSVGGVEELPASEEAQEYAKQLNHIRHSYHAQLAEMAQRTAIFVQQTELVMRHQTEIRPLSQVDVGRVVAAVKKKFLKYQNALKQETCEMIMSLKSKCFDARRKRRNFSKQATTILNEYFERHIQSPYPSEEIKEQLARQCNISVAQVSNWFGNKRIRYKKTVAKATEDKEIGDAMRRNVADAAAMHAHAATMMPFMDPMAVGGVPQPPPFYFPHYDPMMFAPSLHHQPHLPPAPPPPPAPPSQQ